MKKELASYSPEMLKKEIIVLNKIDLIDEDIQNEIISEFSKNSRL